MAHDVFISYASGDKPVADAVCAKLESAGVRCWIAPRDVLPGVHYGEAIIDAIHECRIMVLVFSSKANFSGHIPKEIERAVSSGVTVMPLRIEDVLPSKSLDYFIGSVHWLDAITPPLEIHLQKLAANVQTLLSRSTPGSEPQPPAPVEQRAAYPTPSPAHNGAHARPSSWTHAVIGGLTAIILILGFVLFRFVSQQQGPASQGRPAMVGSAPPQAAPAAQPAAKPVAAIKPESAAVPAPPKKDAAAPVTPHTAPAAPTTRNQIALHYIPGSSIKMEQLIGDQDNQFHKPTRNQTASRYGLQGGDLGYSFEHQGRAFFLFGTTVGKFPRALGTLGVSDTNDPESGVKLDFLTAGNRYLGVQTSDQHHGKRETIGALEIPMSGISVGGQMYVAVENAHPLDRGNDDSTLTRFTAPATFDVIRPISRSPGGHFIRMSMHTAPGPIAGMPSGGPFVILWGTGFYRKSQAYLAVVPQAEMESGKGTRYFAGLDAKGAPTWSDNESDAKAIVENDTLGDISVTWSKDLGLWLMTYDSRQPIGILFSYSRTPWGPWSEPDMIFNVQRDNGLGAFIHNSLAKTDDGLAGPVLGQRNQAQPGAVHGAAYAPYVVERWTKVQNSELNLYYTLSTLNPYVVVLMKSRLQVESKSE